MNATAGIAFAIVSALTLAIAHALLAGGQDKLVIRGLIGLTCLGAVMPFVFIVPFPDAILWGWLLASGVVHAVYQLTLIKAYDGEDFSVAYPLARGVVPLATSLLGIMFLGDQMTAGSVAGVAIVCAGLLYSASTGRPAIFGMMAALTAGLLTTVYTLLDAYAVRLNPNVWTFIVWFFVVDGLIMSGIMTAMRGRRLAALISREFTVGIQAGVASLLTYSSALLALRLLPAGSAAALRETSIVFGVLIAGWFMRERIGHRRLGGAILVAIGGALVALLR